MKKTDVINHFGSQVAVVNAMAAAGISLTEAAVSKWHDVIPEKRALQIERLTKGELIAEQPYPKQAA